MTATATVRLTPQVLATLRHLCADGASNATIAKRMGISTHTTKYHIGEAKRRLGAKGRTHLAVLALRSGLVPLAPMTAEQAVIDELRRNGPLSPRELETSRTNDLTPREIRVAMQTLLDDGSVTFNRSLKLVAA